MYLWWTLQDLRAGSWTAQAQAPPLRTVPDHLEVQETGNEQAGMGEGLRG